MTVAVGNLCNKNTKDFYRGTSFRERGEWESYTHYFCDEYNIDYVRFQGCLLECVKSHLSNSNNYPILRYDDSGSPIGLEDETYWNLVLASLRGTIGPVGPTGRQGPMGPQGPRGFNGSVDNFVVLSIEEWEALTGTDPNKFYFVYENSIEPESFYAYVEGETLNIKGDIEIYTLKLDSHYCSVNNELLIIEAGVNPPIFSKPSGSYPEPITVNISCNTIGAEIYYTFDGTEPTKSSYQYYAPIELESSRTIKAKAFRDGMLPSITVTATYNIGEQEIIVEGETIKDLSGEYSNNTWIVNKVSSVIDKILIF